MFTAECWTQKKNESARNGALLKNTTVNFQFLDKKSFFNTASEAKEQEENV